MSGRACGDGRRIHRTATRGSPQAGPGYRAVHAARPARGLAVHGTLRRRARALAVSPWCLARQAAAGYQVAARAHRAGNSPSCQRGLVS